MDLGLVGKRALVTGSTRGIGRAVAEALLREGASVAIGARTAATVDVAVRELSALGPTTGGAVDAGDARALRDWVQTSIDSLGGLDIYVHNTSAKSNRTFEGWSNNFAIDLMSLVHGVDQATEALVADGGGALVSITTTSVAEHFSSGSGGYTALKAAVTNWTLGQAQVLGARGVRCNVVAPGPTLTGAGGDWEQIRESRPEYVGSVERAHPAGGMGHASDVADAVAFLVSGPARHVNGVNLTVDGGFLKRVDY
jgi:3-oxoacyl-[acyl-carrier protein] reductase